MCYDNMETFIFPLEEGIYGNFSEPVKKNFFVAVDYTVPQVLLSHAKVFVVGTSKIMTR